MGLTYSFDFIEKVNRIGDLNSEGLLLVNYIVTVRQLPCINIKIDQISLAPIKKEAIIILLLLNYANSNPINTNISSL